MGALKHLWNNPYADLKAKQQIFIAIPGNLLLWARLLILAGIRGIPSVFLFRRSQMKERGSFCEGTPKKKPDRQKRNALKLVPFVEE
jgi:hypothetical protein